MFRPAWRAGLSVTHPCLLAGVGVAPCGEPVVPCVARVGFRWKGILGSVSAPLSLLDAVRVLRVPFSQASCIESPPVSQAFHSLRGGAPRSPRCTYPLILALEGNILDDCSIPFPWSSAQPWFQHVWLATWPGPLRVRFEGEEGPVGRTGPSLAPPLSLLQAGYGGLGSVAPARGMWEEVVGLLFVFDTMSC